MSKEDSAAAEELALELGLFEAARFLRSQTESTILGSVHTALTLAKRNPKSPLGISAEEFVKFRLAHETNVGSL